MKAHTHQDARTWNPLETDQAHQSAVSWQTEGQPSLVMTREQITEYISALPERGCVPGSVKKYKHDLLRFYQFLPEGKQITESTLKDWRADLLEQGYAPRTVNASVSVANSFLSWLGRRELQLTGQLEVDDVQPELTRNEYLRLLSAARHLGKERTYLLVKTFTVLGLNVQELPCLTVEAIREGRIPAQPGRAQCPAVIPSCLQKELLDYARQERTTSGPIFVTRKGKPINRTAVTACVQNLAPTARVAPEKCNPRCLRKLYLSTVAQLEASVRILLEQSHERLLEQEQLLVGWNV